MSRRKKEDSSGGRPPILVGVYPGQSIRVLEEGIQIAAESGSPLVFAHVPATSYLSEWDNSRERREASPNADGFFLTAELQETITAAVGSTGVPWTLRLVDGDPPRALCRLADEVGASRIIVGGRAPGVVSAVDEWLSRSVATRLVHSQKRPVIVVPVA